MRRVMQKVMNKFMSSTNWMVLALLAIDDDGSGPAIGVRAAEPAAGGGNAAAINRLSSGGNNIWRRRPLWIRL